MITPNEAYLITPDCQIEITPVKAIQIKEEIRNKIQEHIRTRKFFFLTSPEFCNGSLFIPFPYQYEKYHELFLEIKNEMEKDGWKCTSQFSSCAYGTYYLFLIWSQTFNAKTIKYKTTDTTFDYL